MEKLQFMYGLAIIMAVVISFIAIHLNKALMERDAYRENSLVFEDLLQTEKDNAQFYRELYDSVYIEAKRLEENVQIMNDEIARCHGRTTSNSYYAEKK